MEILAGILAVFGVLATIIGTIQFFEYVVPHIRVLISRLSEHRTAETFQPPGSLKFRPPLFSLPPTSRQLFGREKIMKEMKEWIANGTERVLVIEGIGGIGKTSLVGKLVQEFKAPHLILWIDGRRSDITLEPLLQNLGILAANEGLSGLPKDLARTDIADWEKINLALQYLEMKHYILVFDDFHLVTDLGTENLIEAISDRGKHCRAILISRVHLKLLDNPNILSSPRQIKLSGLDAEATLRCLSASGLAEEKLRVQDNTEATADRIWKQTGFGHPAALRLFVSLARSYSVQYLLEHLPTYDTKLASWIAELFGELTEDEKHLAYRISVFRRPVMSTVVKYVDFDAKDINLEHLVDRFILEVDSEGRYSMHALLQDYCYQQLLDKKIAHTSAASYYLELTADSTDERVFNQLDAFRHFQIAQDIRKAAELIRIVKGALLERGWYILLSRLMQEVETETAEIIAEEVKQQRIAVFLGAGDLGLSIMKEMGSRFLKIALDKITVGWAAADFQFILGNRRLMDIERVTGLLELLTNSTSSVPQKDPPLLIPEYYGMPAELLFDRAEKLNYQVFPSRMAAVVAVDKIAFWEFFRKAERLAPILLPRIPITAPQSITMKFRQGRIDSEIQDFLETVRKTINLLGLPCVLKPAITELGYGQCVILQNDVRTLQEAFAYALKETEAQCTNPDDRFVLQTYVRDAMEVSLVVVRHLDTNGELTSTCLTPILATRSNETVLGEPAGRRLIRGPFVSQSAYQHPIENELPFSVQRLSSQMQDISLYMVELLGNHPGIYAVGFFIKDDQLYLGDQLPVRCEDKLYVTEMSQAHNAFNLLVTTIRQQSIAKAEVSRIDYAAGLHSIIWRHRTSAEMERFDGLEEARNVPFIQRIDTYDAKRFLRPLRVMGMIYAQAPADVPLAEIKKSLILAEKIVTIVPREKGSSEDELIRRYSTRT